ncbi:hypothetical protein GCM10022267_30190 [Lentzea roselyniae]|uniref:Uncharacterized protein n=1 Tax=Lentzea roselyniae TaxID=531940 RepID=A0ABP7AVV8_9PSEU
MPDVPGVGNGSAIGAPGWADAMGTNNAESTNVVTAKRDNRLDIPTTLWARPWQHGSGKRFPMQRHPESTQPAGWLQPLTSDL